MAKCVARRIVGESDSTVDHSPSPSPSPSPEKPPADNEVGSKTTAPRKGWNKPRQLPTLEEMDSGAASTLHQIMQYVAHQNNNQPSKRTALLSELSTLNQLRKDANCPEEVAYYSEEMNRVRILLGQNPAS